MARLEDISEGERELMKTLPLPSFDTTPFVKGKPLSQRRVSILSTALHALAGQHVSVAHLKDKTLDFLDTLWTGTAFCGNWADDEPDCEYTYYALLAMGHLSLA